MSGLESNVKECCFKGFQWDGTPIGIESKLGENDAYVTGSNPSAAILIIADGFGWTFNNTRLLADHYAKEADATVYLPDFFGGEVIPPETLSDGSFFRSANFKPFAMRNSKENRWPEILSCARHLRAQYQRVGAIGYCFGAWACFRLGSRSLNPPGSAEYLMDCISAAQPTNLTKEEIDDIGVSVQLCCPEHDSAFPLAMKEYANTVIPAKDVAYDYQFFPGVEHAFVTRGDPKNPKERRAMVRCKNVMVGWMREWLHGDRHV